ncbi:MAG: hypothetical protein ACI9OJ_002361 [Myxococcota bacterium]|jgi:hypothetical protein
MNWGSERPRLVAELNALIGGQRSFDEVARSIFAFQFDANPHYRRWCENDGVRTTEVESWRDIPLIPVAAFRRWDLRCFSAERTTRTFLTSGTTDVGRGRHHFDDLDLYERASMAGFETAFAPGSNRRIVSLIGGASETPESSLSQMVTWVLERFGNEANTVDPTGESLRTGGPALVLGTAFGLANLLEADPTFRFPEGTTIMETGGFKGRRRELSRADLHELYERAGVSSASVLGEYGMTELSSQWYDGVSGTAPDDATNRVYLSPPWARARVVDPVTLNDVAIGETGLVALVDPVNLGSVQAILTADLGERPPEDNGFIFRGRATGAQVRGCSQRDE